MVYRGKILGVAPKSYLPNYREFYERRQFTSGREAVSREITLLGEQIPFGNDLVFDAANIDGFSVFVECCEDVWTPIPPSSGAALAGAKVLVNLSASNITIGKAEMRRLLCASQSARCDRGLSLHGRRARANRPRTWPGTVRPGCSRYGVALAESARFADDTLTFADVDLGRIRQERMRVGSFGDNAREEAARVAAFRWIEFALDAPAGDVPLRREVERFPYVPCDPARLSEDCYEAYNIQVEGWPSGCARPAWTRLVIGVSGGLDSTQALMVCAGRWTGWACRGRTCWPTPCRASPPRDDTKTNAWRADAGAGRHRPRRSTSGRRPADAGGHRPSLAKGAERLRRHLRERPGGTAHRLSVPAGQPHTAASWSAPATCRELALGWCTYGVGDQMSHYNVNASVCQRR